MSRSKRKAIIKDRPRNFKKSTFYWKRIRRIINNLIRNGDEDLPNPKEIINDYDYCDYVYDMENNKNDPETIKKYRRK